MEFDAKDYKILAIDDYAVGLVQDIIITFKARLKYLIEDMNEDNSDEIRTEISENIELINGLYQDVITNKIYFNTLIKVYYTGMGKYNYHVLNEVEV